MAYTDDWENLMNGVFGPGGKLRFDTQKTPPEKPGLPDMNAALLEQQKKLDEMLKKQNAELRRTFEVRAYNFLVKPIQKEKLFNVLDSYLKTTVETGKIMVKYKDEAHIIDIDDIYYFEVIIKDVFIHLENKTIKCRKKIEAFEEELAPFGFFRTHRSYLVNISKIDSINSKSAIMKNGDEVYVSGKKYAELCEKFLEKK